MNQQEKFSFRKLKGAGLASVAIASFWLIPSDVVHGEEVSTDQDADALVEDHSASVFKEDTQRDALVEDIKANTLVEDVVETPALKAVDTALPKSEVDASSTSPLTFVKGNAVMAVPDTPDDGDRVLKLDLTLKSSEDLKPQSRFAMRLRVPVESGNGATEGGRVVIIGDSLSNLKSDIKIGDTVVGTFEKWNLSFNENITRFKNKEFTLSLTTAISKVYAIKPEHVKKVQLPLDVYLNKHLIHRFNVDRIPTFEKELSPGEIVYSSLEGKSYNREGLGDPLRLDIVHNFGESDIKKRRAYYL